MAYLSLGMSFLLLVCNYTYILSITLRTQTYMEKLKNSKALIFDMDGVLWRGESPIGDLVSFFKTLDDLNLRYAFATNNATKTPTTYVKRFANFGVNITEEQINTSAEVTGSYIAHTYPEGTTAYVFGEDGLHTALSNRNVTIYSTQDIAEGAKADLVVMGLDRNFSYEDLSTATLLVQRGATFIGSNGDKSFPFEHGFLPGAGALQAVVSTATGIEPKLMGKPELPMYLEAARKLGLEPHNITFVGDRLDTDVEGANKAGMTSVLVLSGVAKKEDLINSTVQPDLTIDSIHDLASYFTSKQS